MKKFAIAAIIILIVALIGLITMPITDNASLSNSGLSIIDDDIETVYVNIEWSRRFRRFGIGNPIISGSMEISHDEYSRVLALDPTTYSLFNLHGDVWVIYLHLFDTLLNRFVSATIYFDNNFNNLAISFPNHYHALHSADARIAREPGALLQLIVFSTTNKSVYDILELFGLER